MNKFTVSKKANHRGIVKVTQLQNMAEVTRY